MEKLNEISRKLAIKGQMKADEVCDKMKNKLKEKDGLSGFVVVIILIVAAAVIGVIIYGTYKKGLTDLSDGALNKINGILSE